MGQVLNIPLLMDQKFFIKTLQYTEWSQSTIPKNWKQRTLILEFNFLFPMIFVGYYCTNLQCFPN
jgi:hypothetical protein